MNPRGDPGGGGGVGKPRGREAEVGTGRGGTTCPSTKSPKQRAGAVSRYRGGVCMYACTACFSLQ